MQPARRPATGHADYDPIEGAEPWEGSSDPAQEAWVLMRAVTHPPALLADHAKLAADMHISHGALRALRQLIGSGTLPMSRLAMQMNVDGSYVTGIVDTLEAAGLAERRPNLHDRRVKVVALTPKGRRVAQRARRLVVTPPPTFSALDDAEMATLVGLLRKLRAAEPPRPFASPQPD